MPDVSAFIGEVANELSTWPGVRIGRRDDGAALVRYESVELGVLYPDRGVAELPFLEDEREQLIEHGEAEPADRDPRVQRRQPQRAGSQRRHRGAGAV